MFGFGFRGRVLWRHAGALRPLIFLNLLCAFFIHFLFRSTLLCSSHHVVYPSLFVAVRSQLMARVSICLEPLEFGNNGLGILLKPKHIKDINVPCRRDHGTSQRVHTKTTHLECVREHTKV